MDITLADFVAIGFLVLLEAVLSIDNALVLALLAKPLPKELQKKALTYGLIGAFVFRFIALFIVSSLMKWQAVKFVGGAYLAYVAVNHFFFQKKKDDDVAKKAVMAGFWRTVVVIELTDIAFAVDSILAAAAVSSKLWVVLTGGIIGIVMMRFAATLFISLLKRFPYLETSAYASVLIVGLKLIVDGFHFNGLNFHSPSSPAFWVFWLSILSAFAFGLIRRPMQETRPSV